MVMAEATKEEIRTKPAEKAYDIVALGNKYGTDKGKHRYLEHYQTHLGGLRDEEFNLLEIGIYQGASLRMFRDYFHKARIVGLDIKEVDLSAERRITTYQGSQADPAVLQKINSEVGPFQVVIDDGSHRMQHVRKSFEILFPLLEDGGWYVIEDLSTSYWERYGGGIPGKKGTAIGMIKQLIDGINWDSWLAQNDRPSYTDAWVSSIHLYHNICFLQKSANPGHRSDFAVGSMRFRDN